MVVVPRNGVGQYSGGGVSRAAVEAWEAAESWACTMAAATAAVSRGGIGGVDVIAQMQNGAKEETARQAEEVARRARETARPGIVRSKAGRRQHGDYDGGGGCCCCSHLSGVAALDGAVCRSAIHKRDSILYTSARKSVARESVECCEPVDEVPPRLPLLEPNDSAHAPLAVPKRAPWSEGSLEDYRTARVCRDNHDEMVAVSAAAAVVLVRIERGEEAWRRRSLRVAIEKLRDQRVRACRWTGVEAEAAKVCDKVRVARGLRGMEAWTRRARNGDEAGVLAAAAAAAAVADSFVRKRWMRRLMSMLRR